jgi:hypothetical protein
VLHPEDKQMSSEKPVVESPTGLDLNPKPQASARISKRVGLIIAGVGLLILAGFAYGG